MVKTLFTISRRYDVPARTGLAFRAIAGDLIRVIDLHGAQPVDFWAFVDNDHSEYLSCAHTKPSIEKLFPRVGDAAYTNHRRPIVRLIEDHSPGEHDMQYAACDRWRYIELGGPSQADHGSCQANLHNALRAEMVSLPFTPQPWNLFTNFFINTDGTFTVKAPATRPGDYVILRAELDVLIAVSACPQDLNDTCGGNPTDIAIEIGR
jgi:uncharacterized protein